jgi:hypothetical protein
MFGGNARALRLYCCAATPLCSSVCQKGLRQSSSVSLETANNRRVQPSLVCGHGPQTSCHMARSISAWAFGCTVLMLFAYLQ